MSKRSFRSSLPQEGHAPVNYRQLTAAYNCGNFAGDGPLQLAPNNLNDYPPPRQLAAPHQAVVPRLGNFRASTRQNQPEHPTAESRPAQDMASTWWNPLQLSDHQTSRTCTSWWCFAVPAPPVEPSAQSGVKP